MSIAIEAKLIELEHRLADLEDEVRELHQQGSQAKQNDDSKTLKLKRG
jgi:hypothetical protein